MDGLRNRNAVSPTSAGTSSRTDQSSKYGKKFGGMFLQCSWTCRLVVIVLTAGAMAVFIFSVSDTNRKHLTNNSNNALLLNRTRLTNRVHDDSSMENQDQDKSFTTKSKLFPSWLDNVMKKAATTTSQNRRITFQLFDLSEKRVINNPPPPFFYPVEDTLHSASFVVDNEMHVVTSWMRDLRHAQERLLQANATAPPRCLDIGSNGGFYSLLSRAAGCQTLAVDAQPWCLTRLSSAAAINEFDTNFDIKWTAVGQDENAMISVGATQCSGLWAVKDSGWIDDESKYKVNVSMTPLLTLLEPWLAKASRGNSDNNDDDGRIDVMKIDVEGSEFAVLQSALPLFRAKRIGSVFAEIAPKRCAKISPISSMAETIREIYKAGYSFQETAGGKSWKSQQDMTKMIQNPNLNVIVDYSIRLR